MIESFARRFRLFSFAATVPVALPVALAALLILNACVQDPARTEAPPEEAPASQLLSDAEEHFRQGRYPDALEACEQALALDSSLSRAYYCSAKATLAASGLDRVAIQEDFEEMLNESDSNPFLAHPDSVLTLRLQVSKRMILSLGKLTDRDTLTRWYRYLTEDIPSAEDLADTLFQARHDFMADYLSKADLDIPGYRKRTAFPLSDLKISAGSLAVDYTTFQLVYTITRIYDLDRNDTIDARDSIMKRLVVGPGGLDSLATLPDTNNVLESALSALISGQLSGLTGVGTDD